MIDAANVERQGRRAASGIDGYRLTEVDGDIDLIARDVAIVGSARRDDHRRNRWRRGVDYADSVARSGDAGRRHIGKVD